MSKSENYPDVPAETLGELKSIKRLPGMRDVAPLICWGEEFLTWDLAKQNEYLKRLASTMNHAADVCQKERNEVIKVAQTLETQLTALRTEHSKFVDVMNVRLATEGVEKQKLYRQIVSLSEELDTMKRTVARAVSGGD